MTVVASTKGVIASLLSLVTTGTGTGVVLPISSSNPRVHFRGAGTITSGTVLLEEAQSYDYAGTWSLLYTLDALTLTGGKEQVVHILGTIGAIRARVSANIVGGGTITAELVSD